MDFASLDIGSLTLSAGACLWQNAGSIVNKLIVALLTPVVVCALVVRHNDRKIRKMKRMNEDFERCASDRDMAAKTGTEKTTAEHMQEIAVSGTVDTSILDEDDREMTLSLFDSYGKLRHLRQAIVTSSRFPC